MKADIPKMSISNQVIEAHLALPYLGTDGKLRTRPLAVAAAREVSSGARKRIGPEVVVTALALMGSHAHAPALDMLDLVMRGRIGSLSDFSERDLHPTSPFGQVIAAAFDSGMEPGDW